MTTPKISVVVPIYKVEECLAWCLDSLLAQDMPDWEGVLVNDGSPDGSRDIAAAYCEAHSAKRTRALRWSIKRTGACRARAMQASPRPRRLLSRSWIPTTALRPMHAA